MKHSNPSKSLSSRKKISNALKGKKRKQQSVKKQINTRLKKYGKNQPGTFKKGQRVSPKTEFKSGEKHRFWKGGISYLPYTHEFNNKLKEVIRKRDNYTCQSCKIKQNELNQKLHVHHIDDNKKNNDYVNLISLCNSCHQKIHNNFHPNDRRKRLIKYLDFEDYDGKGKKKQKRVSETMR